VALVLACSPPTVKIKWLFFNASIRYLRVRNAALITTIQKTMIRKNWYCFGQPQMNANAREWNLWNSLAAEEDASDSRLFVSVIGYPPELEN